MKTHRYIMSLMATVATCALFGIAQVRAAETKETKETKTTNAPAGKVGVYESRAVALAWGRSTQHLASVSKLYEDGKKAEASGDKETLARLKKEGHDRQEALEHQVFGDRRIPEVMKELETQLPDIKKKAGVATIVDKRDAPKGAETVDVTSALVQAFHPTAKTLELVDQIVKSPPLKHIPQH